MKATVVRSYDARKFEAELNGLLSHHADDDVTVQYGFGYAQSNFGGSVEFTALVLVRTTV